MDGQLSRSLGGSVRRVNGVLPIGRNARQAGCKSVIVPRADAAGAALIERIGVYPVDALGRLVALFRGNNRARLKA